MLSKDFRMSTTVFDSPAAWNAEDLRTDESWIFTLDARATRDLAEAVRRAKDPGKTLFDYTREDFDFGSAWPAIAAAFRETKRGRGTALVRGLPRAGLEQEDFELLTWAIGLHAGVARPQGKASQYIAAVRDEGTQYRTAGGLPESWRAAYRAVEPRTVRGGIRGLQYDERRKSFEARQATSLSMVATD